MYATPTTPTEFADLIALIVWPADCNAQKAAMDKILDVLSALKRGWAALTPVRLYVTSDTPPSLADWQTAWTDLGYELPISGSVIGLWETMTEETKDVSQYVWIEVEMRPTLARWFNGSSEFFLTTPAMYTNTTTLGTSFTSLISHPLALKRAAYIRAEYAHGSISSLGDIQWQTTLDGASDVRGELAYESAIFAHQPRYFRFTYPTKISSSTLTLRFKRAGGAIAGTINFTNASQTRKIESGILSLTTGIPITLGEISALATEAIYL